MKAKISLARTTSPMALRDADVPDPYYGELEGFDEVVDIASRRVRRLPA